MKTYDHKKIESRIGKDWESKKIYRAKEGKGKKFFPLIEFPYPSGAGMHVGHIRSNTAMDIISRKRRMEGYNVLYPIGWDAFGLPTENYAIKTGKKPAVVTKQNTDTFRKQLKALGFSFDWSREINTTDPKYYKWTQWIFLQLFKKGLAYKAKSYINWCLSCKIGLANEEVVDGKCERCGGPTEKREKEQWMLAITKYADRLDKDLDDVDYLEKIKIQQRNWIGKSEGALIKFKVSKTVFDIEVFTTRADTLFGATYLVLAPEHYFVQKLKSQIKNFDEVESYIKNTKKKSDIERTDDKKEKTGVELKGIKAINPANNEEIPIWVSDYVLADYGTGALMAVPAHDERDFAFAKKFGLSIKEVIAPYWLDEIQKPREDKETEKREVVGMIIRRPSDNKYLCLKWPKRGWQSFPTGGIDGEDLEKAARREILEETGYKNLRFIQKVPGSVYAEFWRPHKGSNVLAHFHFLVFDLENEERDKVEESETDEHVPVWISEEEVLNFLNVPNQKFAWRRFKDSNLIFNDYGIITNSGKFSGMCSEEAKKKITEFVGGKIVTKFKLRDWVFSRQRYWGEPIPLVNCGKCGWVPVPDKDLPVKLPEVKKYTPTDTGESPLASISKWVNTKCPKCKGPAKRETDTMPNWAGSSWYYLRYTDPKNNKEFASKKNLKYWLGSPKRSEGGTGGVDWYNGGMEHTTLHLLYSRFWHKFLYDLKLVPTKEPYQKRTSHGMILGEGGVKMSKSLGNVVNPDDIVKIYGADTLRVYEMFMGPFEDTVAWSTESIVGSRRFIEKVWRIGQKVNTSRQSDFLGPRVAHRVPLSGLNQTLENRSDASFKKVLHKTIKKVSEDIEVMRFNTAVSTMMILATEMEKAESVSAKDFKMFLQILAPFAPYVSEYLWGELGDSTSPKLRGAKKESIHLSEWPKWDDKLIKDDEIKVVIQVNGKLRAEIFVSSEDTEEKIKKEALANESVLKFTNGQEIKKVIYVKNRLVNVVI